jgi:hypothetical protein
LNGRFIKEPSHGTLTSTVVGLVYTPESGFTGFDTFTYQLNDGLDDSNVATVTITVGDVVTGTFPVPGFDSLATPAGTPLSFAPTDLLVNDYDAEGDSLSITEVTEPGNGTIVENPNGTYA